MAANQSSNAKILIVEDEALIRCTLAEALRELGATVVEASTGDEAWEFLTSGEEVDLVFTDHRMPGSLSGEGLARLIRQHYPSLEVIVTSGQPDKNAPRPVVRKPYSLFAVTADLIERALKSRRDRSNS